jgi:hypothetical protein
VLLVSAAGPAHPDEIDNILRDLCATKARPAWDRLVGRGAEALPRILAAMGTPDAATANWLRLAFDEIAARERQAIDPGVLLDFARDPKRPGRARRVALDLVDGLRPGTRVELLAGWLDDPEFRADAIDQALDRLRRDKEAPGEKALANLREVFEATRELGQAQAVAALLKERGVEVSIARHMGFLRDWYLIGPFDGLGKKGFRTTYPPEAAVDLAATLEGKGGKKLRWRRFGAPESSTGRIPVLVNLRGPLGDAEDAVAYAWTAFEVPQSCAVELRGAADDNLTVWVNGTKVFAFEEYHNGVRLDRHRFAARLRAGLNTVLVKVVQAPIEPDSTLPNWEFLLRITDATGKGLTFPPAPSMR